MFRFRFKEARRYSNIDVSEKIAPPIPARRRASELPPGSVASGKAAVVSKSSGIVCTNTDLQSIMNSLKSSANKALQSTTGRAKGSKTTDSLPAAAVAGGRREVLRSGRSNSVDVANLGMTAALAATTAGNSTRNWFRKISARSTATAASAEATITSAAASGQRTDVECPEPRPVTIGGGGEYVVHKSPVVVTFADERPKVSLLEPVASKQEKQTPQPPSQPPPPPPPRPASKKSTGPRCDDVVVVNAEVLGTAIEGFLAAKKTGDSGESSPADCGGEQQQQQPNHQQQQQQQQQQLGVGSGKPVGKTTNDPQSRTGDTSICSSLKDLFVK